MIRLITINKYLTFLNTLQKLSVNKVKVRPKKLEGECKIAHGTHRRAIDLGYFDKEKTTDGYVFTCHVNGPFEPYHARKVIEATKEYRIKKKQEHVTALAHSVESPHPSNHVIKYSNIPPTLKEVADRINELGITSFTAESFMAYYNSNGWKVGSTKMKNWDSALVFWKNRRAVNNYQHHGLSGYTDQELISELKSRGYSGILEVKKEITF